MSDIAGLIEPYTFADPQQDDNGSLGDDFDRWVRELDEDVIQGEYGYEQGEFSVFPSLWWSLYHRKLSPRDAWLVALNEHKKERALEQQGKP